MEDITLNITESTNDKLKGLSSLEEFCEKYDPNDDKIKIGKFIDSDRYIIKIVETGEYAIGNIL